MAQAPQVDREQTDTAQRDRRWLTVGGPVVFLLLWSAGFPIAKTGLHYASPLTFLSIRFALSVGVLLAVCAVKRPQWPRDARAWRHLVVVGFLVQVMYFGLSYLSMTAGIATSVLALHMGCFFLTFTHSDFMDAHPEQTRWRFAINVFLAALLLQERWKRR